MSSVPYLAVFSLARAPPEGASDLVMHINRINNLGG
jgi:hypothetical protein